MSNAYGFDFLRSEHVLNDDDQASGTHPGAADDDLLSPGSPTSDGGGASHFDQKASEVQNKPDLEKQFDIIAFLQAHRGSGCLAPSVIYKATGIDLDVDIKVAQMLQRNPKVRVEMIPDPEIPSIMVATYAYQAKYASVRDRATLLAQINRMTSGIPSRDLLDCYPSVEKDLQALITAGDIIAIMNTEDRNKILFPRGEAFLVELDGIVSIVPTHGNQSSQNNDEVGSSTTTETKVPGSLDRDSTVGETSGLDPTKSNEPVLVELDMDPTKQIRRGEAVQVGGMWFRVSTAVREGVPLSEQPARAQAPLSVVSLTDLSKRNEVDGYIRPFTSKILPLDGALSEAAQQNLRAAKSARERLLKLLHGRTSGVGAQLLGSHAHSSNPATLASSFAGNTGSSSRKRPNVKVNMSSTSHSSHSQQQIQKDTLENAAADPSLALYSHARRHGCTRDIREMYLATRTLIPESDADLQQALIKNKLLDPGEQMRRPRLVKSSNVDNDGKPKKRRYYERKNQRMTNTHLEGTEIGAVLARAAEKQKQGKSVGDGGM